jgi:hypothetical protein
MSKRLVEIQNELAVEKRFEDFNHLLENIHEMEIIKSYFNKASIRYAREVAQASLERASEKVDPEDCFAYSSERNRYETVCKNITNPDNIVLL